MPIDILQPGQMGLTSDSMNLTILDWAAFFPILNNRPSDGKLVFV